MLRSFWLNVPTSSIMKNALVCGCFSQNTNEEPFLLADCAAADGYKTLAALWVVPVLIA